MNEITYHKASNNDIDQKILYDLSILFAKYNEEQTGDHDEFFPANWENEFVAEIIESLLDEDSVTFYAMDGDTPIGYIYAYYCDKCYYTIISDIFVDVKYRGKKVGETLLTKAEEWCKQYKVPMRLEVYDWNEAALKFYRKHGFVSNALILEKKH